MDLIKESFDGDVSRETLPRQSPSLSDAERRLYDSIMDASRRESRESALSSASLASSVGSQSDGTATDTSDDRDGAEIRSRRNSLNILQQLRRVNSDRSAKRAANVQEELSKHLLALHEGIRARDKHISKLQGQIRMLLDERSSMVERLRACSPSVRDQKAQALTTETNGGPPLAHTRIDMLESENLRLTKMVRELRIDNVGLGFVGRRRQGSKVATVADDEWI